MASKKKREKNLRNEERRLTVRGIRRDPPDIRKLSKALIGLAMAEAERQAQAEQITRDAESHVASENETQPGGGRDA